jgi:hypothetical protein
VLSHFVKKSSTVPNAKEWRQGGRLSLSVSPRFLRKCLTDRATPGFHPLPGKGAIVPPSLILNKILLDSTEESVYYGHCR